MSGKIDVLNYENQLILASARKKLQEELKKTDNSRTPVLKAAASILTATEMDLLNYITDDFKKLLVIGAKVRSKVVVNHLDHVMSLSEAMKCVDLGTGSYGGHIARSVKAPGPTNGHNIVRPHERIHSQDAFTAKESAALICKSKDIIHASFDPNPEGSALSAGRKTLNLHNFDVDLRSDEKNSFVKEIEQFNQMLETRRKQKDEEKQKLCKSVERWEGKLKERRASERLVRRNSEFDMPTDDSIGIRFPAYGHLLELPAPMESREVMYSDRYLREKEAEIKAAAAAKAAEELAALQEDEEKDILESALASKAAQGKDAHQIEKETKKLRQERRRRRLWRYFLTKLHASCEKVTSTELDDLSYMICPSELVANIVYYICIVLGITPEWHAAKRSIFKESSSFLSFLQAVNPMDIPIRRLRKAVSFKNESNISNLTIQKACRSCSMTVVEHLCDWVLNFDALANFIIAIEARKERFIPDIVDYDPSNTSGSLPSSPKIDISGSVTSEHKAFSPKSSMSSIKDIMIPKAKRKAIAAAMRERSEDLQAENERHKKLVQRASRKYKHCGLKITDPHEVSLSKLNTPPASPIKKKTRVVIDYSKLAAESSSKPTSPAKSKQTGEAVTMKNLVNDAIANPALARSNSSSSSVRSEVRPKSALTHFDFNALVGGSVTSLSHEYDPVNPVPATNPSKWELADETDSVWQKMAQAARLEDVQLDDDEDGAQRSPKLASSMNMNTQDNDEEDEYADEFMNEGSGGETSQHHTYLPIWDDPAPAVHPAVIRPVSLSASPTPNSHSSHASHHGQDQGASITQVHRTQHDDGEEEEDPYGFDDAWED